MRWSALVLLFGVVLFTGASIVGASAPGTAGVALGVPFTLKPGATARVGPDRVQVQFEAVTAESRCPADVQCIQAGEATVRLKVTLPGRPPETVAISTRYRADVAVVGGYGVTLKELTPVPTTKRPIKAGEYRATLVLVVAGNVSDAPPR